MVCGRLVLLPVSMDSHSPTDRRLKTCLAYSSTIKADIGRLKIYVRLGLMLPWTSVSSVNSHLLLSLSSPSPLLFSFLSCLSILLPKHPYFIHFHSSFPAPPHPFFYSRSSSFLFPCVLPALSSSFLPFITPSLLLSFLLCVLHFCLLVLNEVVHCLHRSSWSPWTVAYLGGLTWSDVHPLPADL